MFVNACRKSERDRDQSLGSCEDELRAQAAYYDLFSLVDEASSATAGIRSFSTHLSCATITTDTLASPRGMTIDFGTTNCTGTDGRTRRGKLLCNYTGLYGDSLTVANIVMQSYYVNDHKIDGTITITNMGTNTNGQRVMRLVVTNGKMNPVSNNWSVYWECTQTFTQTAGMLTTATADDVFDITGTASATGRHGELYNSTIQTALTYQWNCGEVVAGLNDIIPAHTNLRHINYGSGTCDTKVSVDIQGYTYEIHNMY